MKKKFVVWFMGILLLFILPSHVVAGETINFTGFGVQPFQSLDVPEFAPICTHASVYDDQLNVVGIFGVRQPVIAYQYTQRIYYNYNITDIIIDYLTAQNGGNPPSDEVLKNTTIYRAFLSFKVEHMNDSNMGHVGNPHITSSVPNLVVTLARDTRPLNKSTAFSYAGIESAPIPTTLGLQNISLEIDPDLFILKEKNIVFLKIDSECDNIIPSTITPGYGHEVHARGVIVTNPQLSLDIGPPGLSIRRIDPIQVIQDKWGGIPLIKDKPTMVRVSVKLTSSYGAILDNTTLEHVPLEISFDGTTRRLTRNLYNFNKTTYVLDDKDFNYISHLANPSLALKIYQFNKGADAFNFYEAPYFVPTKISQATIDATIDPDNTLGDKANIGVRTKQLRQPVKQFLKGSTYKIKFYLATTPSHTAFNILRTPSDVLKLFTEPQVDYLIATYPAPPSIKNNYKINDKRLSIPGGVDPIDWFSKHGFNHNIDRVVIVMPQGGINELFNVPAGYNAVAMSSAGFRGVFLEETNVDYEEVLAHETGHSYGTLGKYSLYRTFLNHALCDEYPLPTVAPGNYTAECDTDKNPANGIDWDGANFPNGYPTDEDGWDVEQKTRQSVNYNKYARISVDKGNAITGLNHYSFMGKGVLISHWITKNNYRALLNRLVDGGDDPKILVVSGRLYRDDSFILYPFYIFDGIPDPSQSGDYSFEVLDASGGVLSQAAFTPQFNYFWGPDQMSELNATTFVLSLEYPAGADRILFKKGSQTLQQITITPNTPAVAVNVFAMDFDLFNVTWTTSDADGDTVTVMLDYEANETYPLLPPTSTTSSFVLDTSELPGGLAHVILTATDGVNTVKLNSTSFMVSEKSPVMIITSPETDIDVTRTTMIRFAGLGYDPEDGFVNETTLAWFSDITGSLGTGVLLNITLPVGIHTITLNGTDSDGNTASDSIVINVWRERIPKRSSSNSNSIMLLEPANNTFSSKAFVNFTYVVNSPFLLSNCSLVIDGTIFSTDTTIQNNITQYFFEDIGDGNHAWWMSCVPVLGAPFVSDRRTITIDAYRVMPGPLIRLTFNSNLSMYPVIASDSFGNLHIIWYEDEGNSQHSLFYTKLDNNGTTLIDDKRVFDQDVRDPESFRVDNDNNNDLYILVGSAAGLQYLRLNSFGDVIFGPLVLPFGGLTSDIGVEKDTGNVHILTTRPSHLFYQKIDKNGNILINELQISSFPAYPAGIALDADKNAHIFWSDTEQNPRFRYSKVDSSGNIIINNLPLHDNGGVHTSVAIDWNNNAHALSKQDYAKISPNGTKLVEKTLPLTVTNRNPIAINRNNPSGIVHIATTFPEKTYYSLLDNNGTFLIDETLLLNTPGGEVPLDSSVDQNDNLHLTFSYYNFSNQEIYYQKLFIQKPLSQ